jgi:hypothetical protein
VVDVKTFITADNNFDGSFARPIQIIPQVSGQNISGTDYNESYFPIDPVAVNTLTFDGRGGDDKFFGSVLNDNFTGGPGDDTHDGDAGIDTAHFAAALSNSSFSFNTVDNRWDIATGGTEGTDHLLNMEVVIDGSSNTFRLVGAGGYATIQAAIDASSPGDTIVVAPGTYIENVIVNKDVTILGAHQGEAGSDPGRGTDETLLQGTFDITANGATIDGFIINGSTNFGFDLPTAVAVRASDVTIENTIFEGVGVPGSRPLATSGTVANLNVSDNLFHDWDATVYIVNGHSGLITNNVFDELTPSPGGINTESIAMVISANTFNGDSGEIFVTPFAPLVDVKTFITADNNFDGSFARPIQIIPQVSGQNISGTDFNESYFPIDPTAVTTLTFNGHGGDDHFFGSVLNDDFTGEAGDDVHDGDAGIDTAHFRGNRIDYDVTDLGGGQIQVKDLRPGSPDGTDTLINMENFVFADQTFNQTTVINDVPRPNEGPTPSSALLIYTENQPPRAIDTTLSFTDPDDTTLPQGRVRIISGFQAGQDVLNFINNDATQFGNIAVQSFTGGVLTLTSPGDTATVAQWNNALRAVTYFNSSDNPSTVDRILSYEVDDGSSGFVLVDNATVSVVAVNDAPTLTAVPASVTYTENAAPIVLASALVVGDVDSATLSGATVAISAGTFTGDGDVLAANVAGTSITATYNAATETLTLAGTDTLAHYQQVLESVTFSSTSFNADNSGVNHTRTIQWQVNDGSAANNLSAVQTTTLTINALDDNTITDVNGDGRGDVLLQNDNGQPAIWLMNGLTVTSQTNVGTNPGPQWDEIGAGDFNGDHRSDLLFQHDNGTPGIWLMNGTTVLATANPGSPVLWSPQWNVISSGDFNGDGKSDILWQNNNSTPGIWLMDGTNVVAHDVVGSPALWSPAWHVIGSGDFNGDNKSDILWQNNNGSVGVWLMDGLTVLSHNVIDGNPGPAWHVIGAGDFNADGNSDILWQNNNGTAGIWLMNGLNVTTMATPGSNPGPSWNVIGANDLNGDGFADIVWQNDNGQPGGWLMNGTTVLATNFLDGNPGPTWDVIPAHDLV